jgi:hypothetical protein
MEFPEVKEPPPSVSDLETTRKENIAIKKVSFLKLRHFICV